MIHRIVFFFTSICFLENVWANHASAAQPVEKSVWEPDENCNVEEMEWSIHKLMFFFFFPNHQLIKKKQLNQLIYYLNKS